MPKVDRETSDETHLRALASNSIVDLAKERGQELTNGTKAEVVDAWLAFWQPTIMAMLENSVESTYDLELMPGEGEEEGDGEGDGDGGDDGDGDGDIIDAEYE